MVGQFSRQAAFPSRILIGFRKRSLPWGIGSSPIIIRSCSQRSIRKRMSLYCGRSQGWHVRIKHRYHYLRRTNPIVTISAREALRSPLRTRMSESFWRWPRLFLLMIAVTVQLGLRHWISGLFVLIFNRWGVVFLMKLERWIFFSFAGV